MGSEARVYQFAGSFLEVWLEIETSDGVSERSDSARIDEALFRRNMGVEAESFDIPGHTQGWIVVRGQLHRRLELHLREEVQVAENTTLSWTTPVVHLPLPEREGSTLRGGYSNLGSIPGDSVELPDEPGKEFIVFSNTWKESDREAEVEREIRQVTVRLKGRLLGGEQ